MKERMTERMTERKKQRKKERNYCVCLVRPEGYLYYYGPQSQSTEQRHEGRKIAGGDKSDANKFIETVHSAHDESLQLSTPAA